MIAYISGRLVEKKPTEAIIDVQGVGYLMHIPASSYQVLPEQGQPARLMTYHYVREDAILLYGFATEAERTLFTIMLSVSGIGPRLALAALSAMEPGELRDHILSGDLSVLTRIPGVGRKTAERMVVELKDRLARIDFADTGAAPITGGSAEASAARADAMAALESLGVSRAQAEKSLRRVMRDHPGLQSAQDLIRLALRES